MLRSQASEQKAHERFFHGGHGACSSSWLEHATGLPKRVERKNHIVSGLIIRKIRPVLQPQQSNSVSMEVFA